MKFSRAAIALYVGLIFASGITLGVYGQRLYDASRVDTKGPQKQNPEVYRKHVVEMFRDRLHLTDQQVVQLNQIMDETRGRVEETRRNMRPAYQKIHEEQDQKFRAILTPEQQVAFDKLQQEREIHMKQNGRGGVGVSH